MFASEALGRHAPLPLVRRETDDPAPILPKTALPDVNVCPPLSRVALGLTKPESSGSSLARSSRRAQVSP